MLDIVDIVREFLASWKDCVKKTVFCLHRLIQLTQARNAHVVMLSIGLPAGESVTDARHAILGWMLMKMQPEQYYTEQPIVALFEKLIL